MKLKPLVTRENHLRDFVYTEKDLRNKQPYGLRHSYTPGKQAQMDWETLMKCHMNAFAYFNVIPERINNK